MELLKNRAAGVLMHISSLPGRFGIGTMGHEAYKFVDRLKAAGQSFWQILPVCPTGFGDSPYQSFSSFAGNPYFIDLDLLCKEGYLKKSDYKDISWGARQDRVDYGTLYIERNKLFLKLWENFSRNIPADFVKFCNKNSFWLDDFALFMAVKDAHSGAAFETWENDIRCRKEEAILLWREKCSERIEYYKMLQYFFFRQWSKLKKYANKKGISIIGDVPIYVARDGADVWSQPQQFKLDENYVPIEVAGCPPDAFSEEGQLWGNPIYDWDYMKNDGYSWYIARLKAAFSIYDVVRIDHFRGFAGYYCIPFGAENAKNGVWREGPAMELFNAAQKELGSVPIIAEDLGYLTEDVYRLLSDSGFPGMKVLQFAFDLSEQSAYLPKNHIPNCVVYTGTHDNDTLLGYVENTSEAELDFAMRTLCIKDKKDIPKAMMRSALSSCASTAILTMQDLIGLSSEARMNTPAVSSGNWQWRALKNDLSSKNFRFLKKYTKKYNRKSK
ncbi:MAG: 4-alpha-glucanotransferase [Oscillospiraceae bacterium]|nr:4-alpha-glucanotransferase [Oscillospiraceae bacterium]